MTDEIIECIQINGAQHVKERKAAVKGFSAGVLGLSFGLTFAEGIRENYGFRVQLDAAVEATRGFPYLLQLVGYYVLSYAQDASVITQEIVEQALLSAKRDMVKNVYEASLKELSDKDIEFLMAMSQDDGASKVADIQNRLGVEKGYVQPYRARLIKAGVITSPRRGELEFTVPYLAEHLRSLKS